ncbi:NAD+ synthase [Akkermansiaceae bacterium]|nr:NAD+ synthase [Akkermansiaceae bacterium]
MIIGIAQINTRAGDFEGNLKKILEAYDIAVEKGADLVVTPELSLFGYPIVDLVLKHSFLKDGYEALTRLMSKVGKVGLLVGYVDTNSIQEFDKEEKLYFNAAALIQNGQIVGKAHKTLLPKYSVYDQQRYFQPSEKCEPIRYNGHKIGVTIGEDLWHEQLLDKPIYDRDPARELKESRAQVIINMGATHFQIGKPQFKANLYEVIACGTKLPLVCCNAVGGNDQFIFDGHSLCLDPEGNALAQLPGFEECVELCDVSIDGENPPVFKNRSIQHVYDALVLGIRDYVIKSDKTKALVGISGGIDSAVTLALAVKALGAENVLALNMPSKYNNTDGIDDALALCAKLKVRCEKIPITDTMNTAVAALSDVLGGLEEDHTEENMQSRIRNLFIMAVSNKHDYIALSTVNKADLFTGNFTIYGDSVMGLCVLGDVPKKIVYMLADYMNEESELISESIISRVPSPELSKDQLDTHLAPCYKVVDSIIEYYVIYGLTVKEIVEDFGYSENDVTWVQRHIDRNAWKLHQTPPVLRVTSPGYGRGRRLPISQGYVKPFKIDK